MSLHSLLDKCLGTFIRKKSAQLQDKPWGLLRQKAASLGDTEFQAMDKATVKNSTNNIIYIIYMNHRKTWNHGGLYHKTTCDYGNEMEKKKKNIFSTGSAFWLETKWSMCPRVDKLHFISCVCARVSSERERLRIKTNVSPNLTICFMNPFSTKRKIALRNLETYIIHP